MQKKLWTDLTFILFIRRFLAHSWPPYLIFSGTMLAKIHPHDPQFARHAAIEDKQPRVSATSLTVWKKSLVYSCNGFTVFNSSGNLVFRVDSYPSDPKNEVVLMDAAGMALLTMRRKVYKHI